MTKYFLGKRIAVLTAHPDDEGLAAGTMYANHKAGGKTYIICATDGEKGKAHLKKHVSDTKLRKIRRDELRKAAKILKIDNVIFLGLPDTRVRERQKELFEKGLAIARKLSPDCILSFGPDGISAHLDHIAVGAAARRIAQRLRIPLYAFTLSTSAISLRKKAAQSFTARRRFGKYAGIPKHRKADFRIKIDPRTKIKAMRSHKSQFGNTYPYALLPARIARVMLAYEHFVRERI